MKILGIDYGTSKIGVSISEGFLADPYKVIRYQEENDAIEKISFIVKNEGIEKIVVGVSEGESAESSEAFGKILKNKLAIEVDFWDETLSTQEAIDKSIEAGMGREKRKALEDAFAATIMLQSYLDTNV